MSSTPRSPTLASESSPSSTPAPSAPTVSLMALFNQGHPFETLRTELERLEKHAREHMHIDVISACAACLSLLELVLEGDLAETKLKLKIQGLEALLAPLASAATEPQPTAQALLKWIDVSDKTVHADFARYCARCGIIDQRCLITQLRGCDESLKSAIKRIFSHGGALVAFLVQRERAAAVKTALDGLVKKNGVASKAVETFYEVVRKAECPNGVESKTWRCVVDFFSSAVSMSNVHMLSERHLTAAVARFVHCPFVGCRHVTMNEAAFTSAEKSALDASYESGAHLDEFGVADAASSAVAANDYAADDHDTGGRAKAQLRVASGASTTSTVAGDEDEDDNDNDDVDDESDFDVGPAASLVAAPAIGGSTKRSGKRGKRGKEKKTKASTVDEQQKLPFAKERRPDLGVRREKDERHLLWGENKAASAAVADVVEDRRRLNWLGRTCADLHVKEEEVEDGAATTSGAASHCRFGAFGLQVVGSKVKVTLVARVHRSLYVSLLLFKADFAEFNVGTAIAFLTLMIGIDSCDFDLDDLVASQLFPEEEWVAFDRSVTSARGAVWPAPSPGNVQAASRDGGQGGKQSAAVVQREVARGTIESAGDERAVVRSAGGDVAFKVLAIDDDAHRARTDAVSEVRVHEMLTRQAAAHVVPLLSHCETWVTLPGHRVIERKSIILLMPYCERVIGDELSDARDAAAAVDGLLGALAAIHRCAVLHGDVKWSNTLWLTSGERRRLVLADFGLAQQLDVEGGATLRRGVGTKGYVAPEVRDGSALSVTAAADVYSAGMALRKLPAYDACAPLQALATSMCAEKANARPSAGGARGVWRRTVARALHQLAVVAAAAPSTASVAAAAEEATTPVAEPPVSALVRPAPATPSLVTQTPQSSPVSCGVAGGGAGGVAAGVAVAAAGAIATTAAAGAAAAADVGAPAKATFGTVLTNKTADDFFRS